MPWLGHSYLWPRFYIVLAVVFGASIGDCTAVNANISGPEDLDEAASFGTEAGLVRQRLNQKRSKSALWNQTTRAAERKDRRVRGVELGEQVQGSVSDSPSRVVGAHLQREGNTKPTVVPSPPALVEITSNISGSDELDEAPSFLTEAGLVRQRLNQKRSKSALGNQTTMAAERKDRRVRGVESGEQVQGDVTDSPSRVVGAHLRRDGSVVDLGSRALVETGSAGSARGSTASWLRASLEAVPQLLVSSVRGGAETHPAGFKELPACPEGKGHERVGCHSHICTCRWWERCYPRLVPSSDTGAEGGIEAGVCDTDMWILTIESLLVIVLVTLAALCLRFVVSHWRLLCPSWESLKLGRRDRPLAPDDDSDD